MTCVEINAHPLAVSRSLHMPLFALAHASLRHSHFSSHQWVTAIGGHLRPTGPEPFTGWPRSIPWVKPGDPQRRTAKLSPAQFPELKEQLFQSTKCYGIFFSQQKSGIHSTGCSLSSTAIIGETMRCIYRNSFFKKKKTDKICIFKYISISKILSPTSRNEPSPVLPVIGQLSLPEQTSL